VIVFNPFDKRSVAWDVASDVRTHEQARHFAEALMLPAKVDGSRFFTDSACMIVAGVINSLNRTHSSNWDLRRLIHLTANRRRLERVLSGSDLIDQFFSPPETFANIRNTIANCMAGLATIAALWKHAQRKMSLKQWVSAGDSILVLGESADLQAPLQRMNRLACSMIFTSFLSEPESPRRCRLWFFCDDLRGAGRLDLLPALLNGRSKGVRCVLGSQDIEGLNHGYGSEEITKEILNSCASVSWLKPSSTDTAEWAAERCGHALFPSEFLNIPDFASGNVHGVHMIKGLGGVFKASAHYEFPKPEVLDFDPRPESEQFLEPWGPDDDKWLDAGK
jgi:hypothetical protein